MFVLNVCELFGQKASVMIVDEGHRTHYEGVPTDHGRTHKTVADQVTERFRPVFIAFVRDEIVKPM